MFSPTDWKSHVQRTTTWHYAGAERSSCPETMVKPAPPGPLVQGFGRSHMCDLQWAECMNMDVRCACLCCCQDVKVRLTREVWMNAADNTTAAAAAAIKVSLASHMAAYHMRMLDGWQADVDATGTNTEHACQANSWLGICSAHIATEECDAIAVVTQSL